MKKIFALLFAVALLASCGGEEKESDDKEKKDEPTGEKATLMKSMANTVCDCLEEAGDGGMDTAGQKCMMEAIMSNMDGISSVYNVTMEDFQKDGREIGEKIGMDLAKDLMVDCDVFREAMMNK
jgi:hypothetical protein